MFLFARFGLKPKFFQKLSSGSMILLELTMTFSKYLRESCLYKVLMNNSPSNVFYILLLSERNHQNCQVVLAAPSLVLRLC